ncbi:hypothetical protein WJX84_011221 [Apatococcus fuscideae]|uniref:Uncharacterized protein n=1 Tax=Apatococcus fuscideae TaxID=2026836 RepID=A0AAW1SJ61_9CHLO
MDFIRNTLAGLSSCHESSSHVNPLQLFEDRLARAEKELSSLRNSQAKRDAGPIVLTQTGRATSALEEGLDRAVLLDPNQALNSTQRDFGVASGSAVTSKCRRNIKPCRLQDHSCQQSSAAWPGAASSARSHSIPSAIGAPEDSNWMKAAAKDLQHPPEAAAAHVRAVPKAAPSKREVSRTLPQLSQKPQEALSCNDFLKPSKGQLKSPQLD